MNAVWLNDELMVSPGAVAGLQMEWSSGDPTLGSNADYRKMFWFITVVLTSGALQAVWWGDQVGYESPADDAKARTKPAAQAEMARLSELLWPPEPPVVWPRNEFLDMRRIFDPELYGLEVCPYLDTGRSSARCNLAVGHPGDHRWGLTFDEAHPPKVTLTGTVFGTGGGTVSVLVDREVEEYPDLGTRVEVRATPEKARQCGSMSNAGYRCELPSDHELSHWHNASPQTPSATWTHSDHV